MHFVKYQALLNVLANQWFAIFTTLISGVLLNIIIARAIGPEEFGKYSVALAIASFAITFIDGGFSRLLQREVTYASNDLASYQQHLHGYALGHAYTMQLILVLSTFMLFQNWLLGVMLIYYGLVAVNNFSLSVLRGKGAFIQDAQYQSNYRLIALIVISGAIYIFHVKLALGVVSAYTISMLLFILLFSKAFYRVPVFVIPKSIYLAIVPLAFIELMSIVIIKADIVIMDILHVPKFEIGHYSAAFRFIEICLFAIAPINLIIFKRLREIKSDLRLVANKLLLYCTGALVISFFVNSFFNFFGEYIILTMFGESYLSASTILTILAFQILLIFPNAIMSQALLSLDLQKQHGWILGIATLINIGLNLVFIPIYSHIASAWIAVLTQFIIFVLFATTLQRYLNKSAC